MAHHRLLAAESRRGGKVVAAIFYGKTVAVELAGDMLMLYNSVSYPLKNIQMFFVQPLNVGMRLMRL